ncbi:hypothetical protein BDZ89DRAFT_324251 [Hymenopellis radicata]|nr:hypothetical protein BDZ89DRAFT_324251 [Hymenopellis radicata]
MRSTSSRTCFLHTTNKAGSDDFGGWDSEFGDACRACQDWASDVSKADPDQVTASSAPAPWTAVLQYGSRCDSTYCISHSTPSTAYHTRISVRWPLWVPAPICRFGSCCQGARHLSDAQSIVPGELLHLRQPLDLKVFTPKRMAAKLQKIGDDESWLRLTRLAFMM